MNREEIEEQQQMVKRKLVAYEGNLSNGKEGSQGLREYATRAHDQIQALEVRARLLRYSIKLLDRKEGGKTKGKR